MKTTVQFALLALAAGSLLGHAAGADGKDRAITKVVKMLEAMLEKSKNDGDADRKVFAKFLCYCNTNKGKKTDEVKDLSRDIESLETKIEELKASSGKLSKEVAKLDADISANENGREQGFEQREKEADAFDELKEDLTEAIGQMAKAIDTLAEVGADQTLEQSAEDHKKFMAKFKGKKKDLLSLRTTVKEALKAATSFLQGQQKNSIESFLQAPFTGTYTAQSGEVVGILKDMRDTMKANLASAQILEQKQAKAFINFMASAKSAYSDLEDLFEVKQKMLEKNDAALATKKEKLAAAIKQKGICEDFLAALVPLCDAKTKEYNQRNMLRASEDAAITQALSILNSDEAFNLFGKVDATSKEAEEFLQLATVRSHMSPDATRSSVLRLLQAGGRSRRLLRVVALLDAGNPFDSVLDEIKEMLKLIKKEGKADEEKKEWCKDERKSSNKKIDKAENNIDVLEEDIEGLDEDINEPKTGLKDMIAKSETSLEENVGEQKEETEDRTEANLAYQASIADLVGTEKLLASAIKVLNAYYDSREKFDKEEAEEVKKLPGEDDAHPETWEDEKGYKGQSEKGGAVIEMLEFILEDAEKEEKEAHGDEMKAQHEFEDSMTELKEEQTKLEKTIAKLKRTLAEKEADLIEAQKSLKETEAVRDAAKAYLEKIKPGCDFITKNFDKREEHREAESSALKKASKLLKGTPAYKAAESEAELDSLGDCKDICEEEGRKHAKCKACLADVTVPGYCAGHPDTDGC